MVSVTAQIQVASHAQGSRTRTHRARFTRRGLGGRRTDGRSSALGTQAYHTRRQDAEVGHLSADKMQTRTIGESCAVDGTPG
jgi:hypothetical protein